MYNIPKFSIKEMIESGVHFGHKTMRWNPKMAPYIHDARNNIHIIDLQKTVPMFYAALKAIYEIVENNGKVLFVGTKRQASAIIAETSKLTGQFYVNHRWLGGMLTNWETVSQSIKTLKNLQDKMGNVNDPEYLKMTKKEKLEIERKIEKLNLSLGGIAKMGGLPDVLFVVDTNKEAIAINEAKKLGIPVVGIVDSNSDPGSVDYPIPGNDDASRSIKFYCKMLADTILNALHDSLVKSGKDMGEVDEPTIISKQSNDSKTDKKVISLKNKELAIDDKIEKPTENNGKVVAKKNTIIKANVETKNNKDKNPVQDVDKEIANEKSAASKKSEKNNSKIEAKKTTAKSKKTEKK